MSKLPLQAKLVVLAATTAAAALIVASIVFVRYDVSAMRTDTVHELESVAEVLGANLVAALTFDDPDTAKELLDSLQREPTVLRASVFDDQGQLFAQYSKPTDKPLAPCPTLDPGYKFGSDGFLYLCRKIEDGHEQIGRIQFRVSLERLEARKRAYGLMAFGALAVALVGAVMFAVFAQPIISAPIRKLADTAARITAEQNYSIRVTSPSKDQVGKLCEAFNEMLATIESGQQALRSSFDQLEVRVAERTRQLLEVNDNLRSEITERQRAEAELKALQHRHIEAARQAGMAEIATSVLHNVGNVLNSVNVSSNLVADKLRSSPMQDLKRVAELIEQHKNDLGDYVAHDERGRHLGPFLIELSRAMETEEETLEREMKGLLKNVEHIKDIIALQQSHAGACGVIQEVLLQELAEDAIRINISSIDRHHIDIVRDFDELPVAVTDKQKLLQILINLIGNAKHALRDSSQTKRRLVVRVKACQSDRVRLEVQDNGIGIASEHLTKIFSHGFTTKKDGHGFGLHSAALHAKDLGGSLSVHSDGLGRGAVFTLEIPLRLPGSKQQTDAQDEPLADRHDATESAPATVSVV